MTARTLMQQCTDELFDLMRSLVTMSEAAKRGEPMPSLTPDQAQTLLLTVGDALMTNHRALRAKQNSGLVAA
jgi:hypothetical protein